MRRCVGLTDAFGVRVGLHQESALSPYLFNLTMVILLEEVRSEAPWIELFADNIELVEQNEEALQNRLEK